jgi:hypothetical protein
MGEVERRGKKRGGSNIKFQNPSVVGLASNSSTRDSETSLGSMVRVYLKKENRMGQK